MYDIYGATVVNAQKMEQTGMPNRIQISESFYDHLRDRYPDQYTFEEVRIDNKIHYFLKGYLIVFPYSNSI